MGLFQLLSKPDRNKTQLAYKVKYWPIGQLGPNTKSLIVHNSISYMRKASILEHINEDMTTLWRNGQEYEIVWSYNNIPTEIEWNGKSPRYLVRTEFRYSPILTKPVVILSFNLPSGLTLADIDEGAMLS